VGVVGDYVAACGVRLVALQEVQRGQASRLASRLGWWHVWALKHAPILAKAEGAAPLAPSALEAPSTTVLRAAARTSWRRRIALVGVVAVGDRRVTVANLRLSPRDLGSQREDEVDRLTHVLLDGLGYPRSPATIGWRHQRGAAVAGVPPSCGRGMVGRVDHDAAR
jgi:hypothetical protein